MDFLLTGIAFVLIFSILVLIHEGGHFFAARRAGIKVEEFGFGLPPRVWGKKIGETLYSINAIPFGGFVRLLGEEGNDEKALKNKRSFSGKPPRVRIMVIVAGVLMNYLLALFLLTIGFCFGIQPLILDGDDVLAGINDGLVETRQGVIVKDVVENGPAALAGLNKGDIITLIDGKDVVTTEQLQTAIKSVGKPVAIDFLRGAGSYKLNVTGAGKKGLGFSTYDILFLPRVIIHDVKKGSVSQSAGLMAGDVILSINGVPIYYMEDFDAAETGSFTLEYMVERNNSITNLRVELPQKELLIISTVFGGTPADNAGFMKGDVVRSIDGVPIADPQLAIAYTKENAKKDIVYRVVRNGSDVELTVHPQENGLIGVGLSTIHAYENDDLSVYSSDSVASVMKINNVTYPLWIAPLKAFEESGRLAVMTGTTFLELIRSLVTKLTVPEGVAGVVGIAQLTHVFVQEGALPLLRFMALLSLSLAIINIFPLPALDGGKLLFIIVEIIIGRKVGAKFESIVHTIGFVLLLMLILAVTYSDIAKLFV